MLAKIAPSSNDFHTLARYLVDGKPGTTPHPQRVAWVFAQNLPTDEPDLAATYMTATAARSKRTRRAAYHLMIAWHERELPTPEAMHAVARETLEMAGLGEHQALIMGHGDKPHPHLHILLNRVHPETGRAWRTAHDFARFDRIMQALSESHGFAYVPSHAFNPELTDGLPTKPDSPATYAAKRGASTKRLQWSKAGARAYGEALSEDLDQASTWEDVEAALAESGLALEKKGKGYVVGNAASYAKLSDLRLEATAKLMSRERSPLHAVRAAGRSILSVDEIDILRFLAVYGLADRKDISLAVEQRAQDRAQRLSRAGVDLRDAFSSTNLKPRARAVRTKARRPRDRTGVHTKECTLRMQID